MANLSSLLDCTWSQSKYSYGVSLGEVYLTHLFKAGRPTLKDGSIFQVAAQTKGHGRRKFWFFACLPLFLLSCH